MGRVVTRVALKVRTVLRVWSTCLCVLTIVGSAVAAPAELLISEIVEGSSNNKAVEIYNGTGAIVDLNAEGYQLVFYFNGNSSPGLVVQLNGTLPDGEVFVFAHSSSDAAILAVADQVTGSGLFNGDDAIVLTKAGVVVDSFGQVGTDPGTEWPGGGLDDTLRRKPTVCTGDTQPGDEHLTAASWDVLPINTFDGLGAHTVSCGVTLDEPPELLTTSPVQGAAAVPLDSSIVLGFSEPVTLDVESVLLQCAISGELAVSSVTGQGTAQLILQPSADFVPAETCTLFLPALAVNDLDADPDPLAEDFTLSFETREVSVCGGPATPISAVQGSGTASPLVGQTVTVEGVVVGDFQGLSQLQGFFLQSPDSQHDADPGTSEGLFVYAPEALPEVDVGDVVRVTGTVAEYFDLTELTSVSDVQVCGVGANVMPSTLLLPFDSLTDLESFEGMLVQVPQRLFVTDNYNLARYGEVLLSVDERLWQPTQVAAPGPAADAVRASNLLSSIQLDDGSGVQNPAWPPHVGPDGTLRVGDSVTGIRAVLGYGFGSFELHPTESITFERTNPRPTPPAVGGTLRVASFNVLNYFTTLDAGASVCGPLQNMDCRGANTSVEFERQRAKILAALTQLDADIVGLIELENNSSASLSDLVAGLNQALGADTYDFVDTGTFGSDAIKVGFIYQPAKVSPWGLHAVLDSTVDPSFDDTRNRPVLAQTFEELNTGERLTVALFHLKSKGSACGGDPDLGDGQGNCNATRVSAAAASLSWLTSDPTDSGDPDFLMLGDFNAYAQEDPIRLLTDAGLRDLLADFVGPTAYSYVFEGQSGALDQALASMSLASQVTGATEWHINTDEPRFLDYNTEFNPPGAYQPDGFRSSDHDPLVVGLELSEENPTPTCDGRPRHGRRPGHPRRPVRRSRR